MDNNTIQKLPSICSREVARQYLGKGCVFNVKGRVCTGIIVGFNHAEDKSENQYRIWLCYSHKLDEDGLGHCGNCQPGDEQIADKQSSHGHHWCKPGDISIEGSVSIVSPLDIMHEIKVDSEVIESIWSQKEHGENLNTTLRRVFGIEKDAATKEKIRYIGLED